ncbi:hypothetical protein [Streptomyces sp. NPDC005805]|uniref:hypothetical protein n=1 Tax=Streptomyces sp. NPDC005805 TaxID=3157068 RepID=UPI0033E8D701
MADIGGERPHEVLGRVRRGLPPFWFRVWVGAAAVAALLFAALPMGVTANAAFLTCFVIVGGLISSVLSASHGRELDAVTRLPVATARVTIRAERYRFMVRGGPRTGYVLFCWAPGDELHEPPSLATSVGEETALRIGLGRPIVAQVRGTVAEGQWVVFELPGRTVIPDWRLMKRKQVVAQAEQHP